MSPSFSLGTGLSISTKVRFGRPLPPPYSIGGASPELVAAFLTAADGTTEGEYFRTGGVEDDFSMFTFSRSGLATMFDSTGTLVWAPHNLVTYSEDFSNADWTKTRASIDGTTVTAPDGTDTANFLVEDTSNNNHVVFQTYTGWGTAQGTAAVCAKQGGRRYISIAAGDFSGGREYAGFDLDTGTVSDVGDSVDQRITALGDGWYLCEVDFSDANATTPTLIIALSDSGTISDATIGADSYQGDGASGVYIWGAHLYRSDLGGMADNPDQTVSGLEKYVPTTTAAVYLPRRNAYYYNGTSWVKGGLQLESAAATNLLTYSKDFTNATWTKLDVTVALDAGDVYEVTESGTGSQTPYVLDAVSGITIGNYYCIAVDVKDVDRGYAFLQWTDGGNRFSINVDLSDGSVTDTDTVNSPSVIGYGASPNGDGWYRLWISATTASTNGYLVVGPSDSATPSWTSQAVPQYTPSGKKIQVRYAQLEAGSVPTSYIPTTGSTVTRAAETLSIASGDWPYNSDATTIFMKGLASYVDDDTYTIELFNVGNTDFHMYVTTSGGNTGRATIAGRVPTTEFAYSASDYMSPGVNIPFNLAGVAGANLARLAASGVIDTQSDETGGITGQGAEAAVFGKTIAGFISEIRMWGTDIGDSGVVEVTS